MKLLLLLILIPATIAMAQEPKESALLEQLANILKKEDAIKDEQLAILNGVRVESLRASQLGTDLKKTGESSIMVNISHPNSPSIGMSIGNDKYKSTGIGIFQKGTGKPYVTIEDINGDGVFDSLRYSVLSKNGEWLVEVEDYGMDGIADFRMYIKEKRSEVFYQGKWLPVNKEPNGSWVLVNKEKIPLNEMFNRLGRNKFQ